MIGAGVVSMKHFQHKRWFDEGGETAGNREPANLAYATANLCVTPEPKTENVLLPEPPRPLQAKMRELHAGECFQPRKGVRGAISMAKCEEAPG